MATRHAVEATAATKRGKYMSAKGTPTVSLCIPAYQAERHLRETLNAAFAQTCQDMEILVLDNNTTDGTRRILDEALRDNRDARLRVVRNDHTLSMPDNWNRVVELCRAPLIKLLCADDLIEKTCVQDQADILINNPDVALVACKVDLLDDAGHPLRRSTGLRRLTGRHDGRTVVRHVVRSGGNPIGPSAAVTFRRKDFTAVGGFNGDLLYPMELELWTRLLQRGDFVGLPNPMAAFRISAEGATAFTSVRAQFGQQAELSRRIAHDAAWRMGSVDRFVGWLGAVTMQARRSLLFSHSAWRYGRRSPTVRRALESGSTPPTRDPAA
ncbi:glycosyltransferase family A protein [Mycolicibacterium sp.]|uniref:glycosyltransferase family 2 protein n=1 Tax=Mycolicibacterium sp. TaxID=2320850 RepID=UPI001A3611C9|nr:glycosyltransferase family A protein [Mycolicibacterium sp.]MBJ7338667.1 glycosyltransferase family 2 protein [Mycolicibacterium sp.]